MHRIPSFIFPIQCPYRLWTKGTRHFRIPRSTKFPQCGHCIILPYFHSYAASIGELVDKLAVLGQHCFVQLQELLGGGAIEPEHLHCTDLEPCVQDHVQYLTHISLVNDMRLDNQARTATKKCRAFQC